MIKFIRSNLMLAIGICLSAFYILILICIAWYTNILNHENKLTLNELGDFLAGAFSPLAFLWLVIGYLTQGKELKLNRQMLELQAEELKSNNVALTMQAEELKNSVKAQNDMVELNTRIIENEAKRIKLENSPPVIDIFIEKTSNVYAYAVYLQNVGGPATEIKLSFIKNTENKIDEDFMPTLRDFVAVSHLNADQQKVHVFNSKNRFIPKESEIYRLDIQYKEKSSGMERYLSALFEIDSDKNFKEINSVNS